MKVSAKIEPLMGGMNAATKPHVITDMQFARGVNIDVRGGFARTRPGFKLLSAGLVPLLPAESARFQGAERWTTADGEHLVSVFEGQVFLTNLDTGVSSLIGPYMVPGEQVFMAQADQYLVLLDGTNVLVLGWSEGAPTIKKTTVVPETLMDDSWDEEWAGVALIGQIETYMAANTSVTFAEAVAAVLASQSKPSFPPGSIVCYAHGRLHMVSSVMERRYFLSSDILLPSEPESVLRWWENMYLNSGGGMGLPEEMGEIRAMAVMRQSTTTASGMGALVVFAQHGVAAFNVFLPRAGSFDIVVSGDATNATYVKPKLLTPGWKDQQISQVLFYGSGTECPWAVANVNGDLFYRSQDGWRTLKHTAQAATGSLIANAPASSEVQPFIDYDPVPSQWMSAGVHDHRLFMTCSGQDDRSHLGLIVYNSNTLTTLGQQPAAAFEGLWTGFDVVKLVGTPSRMLMVCSDGRIYEQHALRHDLPGAAAVPVECQLMTKQLAYRAGDKTAEGFMKELDFVDLWCTDVVGTVSVSVYYRPDNHPYWTLTETRVIEAGTVPEERRRFRFTTCPVSSRDKMSRQGSRLTQGETFQFLVIWTGEMTLRRLYTEASVLTEAPPVLTADPACATITLQTGQIVQDDFSYKAL
jgi:hypothetical protein